MKRMFKQWWSWIPPISIKRIFESCFCTRIAIQHYKNKDYWSSSVLWLRTCSRKLYDINKKTRRKYSFCWYSWNWLPSLTLIFCICPRFVFFNFYTLPDSCKYTIQNLSIKLRKLHYNEKNVLIVMVIKISISKYSLSENKSWLK
jgi:hypothetical protein